MTRSPLSLRRSALTLALTATVALAAGCGGGGKSSSGTAPAAATTTSTASTTSTSTPLTVPSAATNSAQVQRAVAACHSLVKATPTLTAQARTKVEGICDKAAHGDIAGARAAAKEACAEIINGAPGIAGPLKARALARCSAIK